MQNRRDFIRNLALAGAALPFAVNRLAISAPFLAAPRPTRVRGIVRLDGRGMPNVAVSDGLAVVPTGKDGTFELLSDARRQFCSVSLPPRVEIPISPRGSAAHFRTIIPDAGGEATAEFDLRRSEFSDERHGFLVLADPQTLDQEDMTKFHTETVPDLRSTAEGLRGIPLFGVGCGDLMFDRLSLFPEYEEGIRKSGIPFFQVLGNHDVETLAQTDEASVATFTKRFGPAYYSFNRGAFHYVVLDDVLWLGDGYVGYLTNEQLEWLRSDLALVERGKRVVCFLHIPVYCTQHVRFGERRPEKSVVVNNRNLLYELLAPYRARIIAGHMHETEHVRDGGVDQHVCGAVCGAWWTGPICADGTPGGYGVYTANGEDLEWRYKGTGLPGETQMRLYPAGTDPASPQEIIANIWDWDPSWKVTWHEDGMRKGEMKQVRGVDPLSIALHRGPQLPAKHTWVDPYVTDHLFRGAPSPGAGTIVVEAIDRFGRVHTGRV